MAKVKFKGFDANDLIKEIKKDVEKDLKKNPGKILNSHIGDIVEANCSKCGETTIEVLRNGKARCTKCGLVTEVDLSIDFK